MTKRQQRRRHDRTASLLDHDAGGGSGSPAIAYEVIREVLAPDPDLAGKPLSELVKIWANRPHLAEVSQEVFRYSISAWAKWLGEKPPHQIRASDIERFIFRPGRKPSAFALGCIMAFLRWTAEHGLRSDRLPKVERAPKNTRSRRPFTHQEFTRILKESWNADRHDRYWPTLILLGWHTGLRFRDCCLLRWGNVDFETDTISLMPSKTRRLGKHVSIPMDTQLSRHLRALWDRRTEPESPYVSPVPGRQVSWETGRRCLIREFQDGILHRLALRGSFHGLRHAFVSRLLNAGVDHHIVASMTGHSLEEIATYAHISMDAKRDALNKARQGMQLAKLQALGVEPEVEYDPNQNQERTAHEQTENKLPPPGGLA